MNMTEPTRSCCAPKPAVHHTHEGHEHQHAAKRPDIIFYGSLAILVSAILGNLILESFSASPMPLHHFAHASIEILLSMWWGIALGIIIVGLMSKMPRDFFMAAMGSGDSFSGILRAVFAGVFLDLCCHGILLVAAKLYERGVSLPQVMAFLIASPWNSLSLTLVLAGLIGWTWTMAYILGSMFIALTAGLTFQKLMSATTLPPNPHKPERQENLAFLPQLKSVLKTAKFSRQGTIDVLKTGWSEGRMIIKWLLFGTIIAASIRAFIPPEIFGTWFGATLFGLLMTVIVATLVEICSEGSAPVAGELFRSANAPGNGFAFLMAGVATDYTEILALREFTKSWKIAIALPLITVPQVVLIAWIMNTING